MVGPRLRESLPLARLEVGKSVPLRAAHPQVPLLWKNPPPPPSNVDFFYTAHAQHLFNDESSIVSILAAGVTLDTLGQIFPLSAANGFFLKSRNKLRTLSQLQSLEDQLEDKDEADVYQKASARSLKDNERRVLVNTPYGAEDDDLSTKIHTR